MSEERRSEPRRGLVARVGLLLAATGMMSAAVARRELAGAVPDWHDTILFGAALALVLLASAPRPPLGRAWTALGGLSAAPQLGPLVLGLVGLWLPLAFLVGAPLGPVLWLAALAAVAAALAALADRTPLHPSERLRRVGYAALAIALVSASAMRTLVLAGPGGALVDALTAAAVLALLVLSYLRPARRDTVALAIALAAFVLLGALYVAATPYGNDAVAARHHAALLLAGGRHPYADFDVVDALARFGLDPRLATHLQNDDVVHTYSYPALSFLAVAPFAAAGLGDVRWLDLAVLVAIALVAVRAVRPGWRPFALAAVVGNAVVARQYLLGGIDPLWVLLLLGAWRLRGSAWGAVLLGLALADRQPAWFALPFVVLAIAQSGGAGRALRTAAIALGVALAVQLPFLATAPGPTLEGVLGPLLAPIDADGVGLVQLGVVERYTPVFPRITYTLLAVGLLALLLVVARLRGRALSSWALSWPFVPLFFAWRSLQNYFAFVPILALAADDEIAAERPDGAAGDGSGAQRR